MNLTWNDAGDGPLVGLLHGGMATGDMAWFAQAPLEDRWKLRRFDRAGYGRSSELSAGEDVELDAELVAQQADTSMHLVGHSSGAVAALLAVARAPESFRSLTIIEPPLYGYLDDPRLASMIAFYENLWRDTTSSDREWLVKFFSSFESTPRPEEILARLDPNVPAFRRFVRRPWEVGFPVPIEDVVASGRPVLVVSGGHDDAFELLNDRLAADLDARREVVVGAGHTVQMTGEPFNEVLDSFLREVERQS